MKDPSKFVEKLRSNGYEVLELEEKEIQKFLLEITREDELVFYSKMDEFPELTRLKNFVSCEEAFDLKKIEKLRKIVLRADFGVSETGSLLITNPSGFSRIGMMLAHEAIFILRKSDIVETMEEAFEKLSSLHGKLPSLFGFLTGLSVTSDIEKKVVKGVYGPEKIIAILIQ